MLKDRARFAAVLMCLAVFLIWQPAATADDVDLSGPWYGTGHAPGQDAGGRIAVQIFQYAPGLYAGILDVPDLGYFNTQVPVTCVGSEVTIGVPGVLAFVGELDGDSIGGTSEIPYPLPPYVLTVDWRIWRDTGQGTSPGPYPEEPCDDLPDLLCAGSAAYCSALVPFEPVRGPGYDNYPANGETWDDQYRSYLRRDLRQVIAYATAKVACLTAEWDYWKLEPLGLGDMSEADGAIPGESIGYPGHPPGTHEDGQDIDLAYYQLFAPNNYMRPIGAHHDGYGADQHHLVEPPFGLDIWRTALLLACLSEHPRMRVIGVDGQAGPLLDAALDELVALGWIKADLRNAIPLVYEVEDMGWGFYYFHHHHIHVSFRPVVDILESVDLKPETLSCKSKGKTISAFLELAPGHDIRSVAPENVALMLDGHTRLYAEAKGAEIGDYDKDGIPDLMVKFDRQRLLDYVGTGEVELTLTGVTGVAGGKFFQGTDTLRVIRNGHKENGKK